MVPKYKIAGLAGIATGIGLIGEFLFFSISGYSPDKFKTYAESLAFLQRHGVLALRLAVLFGIAGAAVRIIYVAGLAERLRAKSPTQAVATLYFGILGSIGHGLVALSFYTGLPLLLKFAEQDHTAAVSALGSFTIITSGFQALGNALLGLMLLGSGLAIVRYKALPVGLGRVGVAAGIITLTAVLASGTALSAVAYAAFIPSFILAIIFDIWAGLALRKVSDQLGETPVSSLTQG